MQKKGLFLHIVLIGSGNFGTYLAKTLSREKQNVTVIDKDESAIERFEQEADVATILASGTDWQTLSAIPKKESVMFLAMTGTDETNLVACNLAKSLGFPYVVARITDPSFLDHSTIDAERLFLVDEMIAPNLYIAHDLAKNVLRPAAIRCETFAHGMVEMHTFCIPENWEEKKSRIEKVLEEDEVMLGVIKRGEDVLFTRDPLQPNDEATFIGETNAILQIASILEEAVSSPERILIFGGTETAIHLARILHEQNKEIKIIEEDQDCCSRLSEILPFCTILHHDPTEIAFLQEERVETYDSAVACSLSTERNILMATICLDLGVKNVVTLAGDMSYSPILKRLGITFVISEKMSIANRIVSLIYAEALLSTYTLYDALAKILEVKVTTNSNIVGIPIEKIHQKLPKNASICLIENRGRIMAAKGHRILAPGDRVFIFTDPGSVLEINNLF